MLKLKKGKKKKGKKDKDDLFDPEQLAKYKREKELAAAKQAQEQGASANTSANAESNEEWKRFQLLTGGIDDILNKASADLDRIKQESFYQKKPAGPAVLINRSHVDYPEEEEAAASNGVVESQSQAASSYHEYEAHEKVAHHSAAPEQSYQETSEPVVEPAPVELPPEEEPVELGDELFDTSFVEAIASGEIKLAYIPESPDEPEGDDPFDTSGVADVVKRIAEAEKKEKRKVDLGLAVNKLTNSAAEEAEALANSKPAASRRAKRQALLKVNLLGTFDESGQQISPAEANINTNVSKKDIFDEIESIDPNKENQDGELELRPVAFVKQSQPQEKVEAAPQKQKLDFSEFEDFEEIHSSVPPLTVAAVDDDDDFAEFDELAKESITKAREEDPFDTSYIATDNVLDDSYDILTSATEVTDTTEVAVPPPRPPAPPHPPPPKVHEHDEDPFDTSAVEVVAPCQTQLKLLEEELLPAGESAAPAEPVKTSQVLIEEKLGRKVSLDSADSFDFDPRKGEEPVQQTIQEAEPEPEPDPFDVHLDEVDLKLIAENKAKELAAIEPEPEEIDPFDTSAVKESTCIPGKIELRELESELIQNGTDRELVRQLTRNASIAFGDPDDFFKPDDHHAGYIGSEILNPVSRHHGSESADDDFEHHDFEDPFDTSNLNSLVKDHYTGKIEIKDIENELLSNKIDVRPPRPQMPKIDLDKMSKKPENLTAHPLDKHHDDHPATPLQPLAPINPLYEDDVDPFDTSIADFVRPSTTEIRLLEEELHNPRY